MNGQASTDAFRDLLAGALGPFLSLAVPSARMLGVITILPIFARLSLTGLLRGGVALALSIPLAVGLQGSLAPIVAQSSGGVLTGLLVKEALVGLLIGLVAGVPFWAAQTAGELIDQQRGSTSALLPDPSGDQVGITGTILTLTSAVVFLGAGGFRLLQQAVYASYQLWPPEALVPRFSPGGGSRILEILDQLLGSGVLLASPLVVAMLMAELALGLISRFVPNLNVFDLAMSVKNIIHVVGLPIYAVVLVGYLRDGLVPLAHLGVLMQGFAP